jgi:hypothetical protein
MNLNLFSQSNEAEANKLLIRVEFQDAHYLLLENKSIIVAGTARFFRILPLGLNVYQVGLAEKTTYDTRMCENYIPSLKDDGTKMFPYMEYK